MSKSRNLLLCFDAFGTLFKIKQPIEQQYADVARRQFGLTNGRDGSPLFTDDQLHASFRAAFKAASRQHPNYGHTSNMGATAWWTAVIEDTFRPFVGELPRGLAPRLIERFASSEAYTIAPQLTTLLRELRQQKSKRYDQIIVGVITSSDDRVPDILSSMGLHVSPLRYGSPGFNREIKASTGTGTGLSPHRMYDIDFHCMSYDVGAEKPDPRIFKAAEEMLLASKENGCHAGQQGVGQRATHEVYNEYEARPLTVDDWDKMYVGDEWDKDVVGAQMAGWFPVILRGPGEGESSSAVHATTVTSAFYKEAKMEARPLMQIPPQSVDRLSKQCAVVSVASIASLLNWLTG